MAVNFEKPKKPYICKPRTLGRPFKPLRLNFWQFLYYLYNLQSHPSKSKINFATKRFHRICSDSAAHVSFSPLPLESLDHARDKHSIRAEQGDPKERLAPIATPSKRRVQDPDNFPRLDKETPRNNAGTLLRRRNFSLAEIESRIERGRFQGKAGSRSARYLPRWLENSMIIQAGRASGRQM